MKEELAYNEKVTGRKGFQGEGDFGAEVLMQTAKDDTQSMLTSQMLSEHLRMVKKIKEIRSVTYGVYVHFFCLKKMLVADQLQFTFAFSLLE